MSAVYYASRSREQLYAVSFGILLAISMISFFVFALLSVDTLVLGTEMNANGTVEYLCLGTGCETVTRM